MPAHGWCICRAATGEKEEAGEARAGREACGDDAREHRHEEDRKEDEDEDVDVIQKWEAHHRADSHHRRSRCSRGGSSARH